ncbi:MAG: VWA domain-containing protein [Dehalococcoidia bacterium]
MRHVQPRRLLVSKNARRPLPFAAFFALGAVGALMALFAAPRPASGADEVSIVSVDYQASGTITAALRMADPALQLTNVRAVVDGVPYPARVATDGARPVSVVVAIDASASMEGAPLEAARQAAISLVDRLGPEDRVAVIAFSDTPVLMSGFEGGAAGAIGGLQTLWLGGSTSLYAAIDDALALLAPEVDRTRAVVLLSDGQDTLDETGAGDARRAEVLGAIEASDAQFHAFAFGAGADHDFLSEAAARGDGGFWSVTDAGALEALFSHLGARLGATTQVSVAVPPLERGEHLLVLHTVVAGAPVDATSMFEARNEGFVWLTPRTSDESGPLVVDVSTMLPVDGLVVSAQSGDTPLEVIGDPARVLLDPWAFAPGELPVTVQISTRDAVIAEAASVVAIPTLDPALTFAVEAGERGEVTGILSGRAQAESTASLIVRHNGMIIATERGHELRFAMPRDGGALELSLEADGRVLRTLDHDLALATVVSEGGPWRRLAALAVLLLAALGAGGWWSFRRRRETHERWQPSGRTALVGRQVPGTRESLHPLGTVIVQTPEGEERRYELRRRPLSVGSSDACDVAIRDEGVAAVHARLYALGDGEFRIHGIAPRGVPDRRSREDEWVVVRHGEQVTIGRHLLTLYSLQDAVPQDPRSAVASGGVA